MKFGTMIRFRFDLKSFWAEMVWSEEELSAIPSSNAHFARAKFNANLSKIDIILSVFARYSPPVT